MMTRIRKIRVEKKWKKRTNRMVIWTTNNEMRDLIDAIPLFFPWNKEREHEQSKPKTLFFSSESGKKRESNEIKDVLEAGLYSQKQSEHSAPSKEIRINSHGVFAGSCGKHSSCCHNIFY